MRKKPPGKIIKGAHAVDREYRIMKTLGDAGFEVPTMHMLCEDDSVIGSAFYVMQFVEGRILGNDLAEVEPQERTPTMFAIIGTLAKLHSFDPHKVGLLGGDKPYGKDGGFYERQIQTMKRTAEAQVAKAEGKIKQLFRLEGLLKAFAANMPSDISTVIHGDFKPDNCILGSSSPTVIGLIDWELSTIGHPLSDLANVTLAYTSPKNFPVYPSFDMSNGSGIPPLEDVLKEYCRVSGMSYPIQNWNFYTAFAWFRLSVIIHGIAARASQGQASNAIAGSDVLMQAADFCGELSWSVINGLPLPEVPDMDQKSKL
jgi:aminoglycoside phosphotransferase (APT) family kinase protein